MKTSLNTSKPDFIAGIESRGFIFGAALANLMNIGFIPIRKKGKLPVPKIQTAYKLEYSCDIPEIQTSMIEKSSRISIIDDVIDTGGTAKAAESLFEISGCIIDSFVFAVELTQLKGRNKLKNKNIVSIIKY